MEFSQVLVLMSSICFCRHHFQFDAYSLIVWNETYVTLLASRCITSACSSKNPSYITSLLTFAGDWFRFSIWPDSSRTVSYYCSHCWTISRSAILATNYSPGKPLTRRLRLVILKLNSLLSCLACHKSLLQNRNILSEDMSRKKWRTARKDVLLNYIEVLERIKAGVVVSSALAELGLS